MGAGDGNRTRAVTIAESEKSPAVAKLHDLAESALTRIAADTDERQATTRRNLAGFRTTDNVSMIGGRT
ncbi:hypothetical protein ACQPZP_01830 [Spirillospora sp. CA-142024]|uniref:hypothetical protein n=1 Tax=Spirillospora sp. CA-142024 TaxID=3240036 RepID=UPI003D9053F5